MNHHFSENRHDCHIYSTDFTVSQNRNENRLPLSDGGALIGEIRVEAGIENGVGFHDWNITAM